MPGILSLGLSPFSCTGHARLEVPMPAPPAGKYACELEYGFIDSVNDDRHSSGTFTQAIQDLIDNGLERTTLYATTGDQECTYTHSRGAWSDWKEARK